MEPSETVSTNAGASWELDGLRSICSRQVRLIRTLIETVSTLRTGTSALKAENADLRAQISSLSRRALGSPL